MSLDLIPWEQQPQVIKDVHFEVEWKGGMFYIPRLGYLTVNELDQLGIADPKNALNRLLYQTSVELSRDIGDTSEPPVWTPYRCFQLLLTLHFIYCGGKSKLTPEEKTIEILHQSIVLPFLDQASICTNRVVIRSVTILLNRIRPDWTDEQTRKLPGELRQVIHALFLEEQNAGKEINPEEEIKEIENMLGKSLGVRQSVATDQTGETSIGNASDSGQDQQNLAVSDSESSPAIMSSKPLKRVTKPRGNISTAKKLQSAS